jgi:homoserine dehydrogenase
MVDAGRPMALPEDVPSAFYLRLMVLDQPGVLAAVARVFGDEGVSIRTVVQKGEGDEARLVLVLHRAPERRVLRALERLRPMRELRGEPVVLRVLGSGDPADGSAAR